MGVYHEGAKEEGDSARRHHVTRVSTRYVPTLVCLPHPLMASPNPVKLGTSQHPPHACEHLLAGWAMHAMMMTTSTRIRAG